MFHDLVFLLSPCRLTIAMYLRDRMPMNEQIHWTFDLEMMSCWGRFFSRGSDAMIITMKFNDVELSVNFQLEVHCNIYLLQLCRRMESSFVILWNACQLRQKRSQPLEINRNKNTLIKSVRKRTSHREVLPKYNIARANTDREHRPFFACYQYHMSMESPIRDKNCKS